MKNDARVRYTQMIIRQTFLNLLKEKPLSKITVKEICEIAEINRTTFYKHYRDPYDLLEQMETEAISGLMTLIEKNHNNSGGHTLLAILRAMQDDYELFKNLDLSGNSQSFTYRLSVSCFQEINELSMQNSNLPRQHTSGLAFSYLAGGCSGIIEYWLHGGMKESPETIADTIIHLNRIVKENT